MYKAILFDLDDTLYDFYTYRTEQLQLALANIFEHYPYLQPASLIQRAIDTHVYHHQLPTFLRTHGVDDEALITAACATHEYDWFEKMQLDQDAIPLLEWLRPTYKLGLVTNGPSWTQRAKIEQFQLAAYMDVLTVSEEVGIAKPDPIIFHMTLEQLDIQPGAALFVGDSPEHDLCGANAAGIQSIWINRRGLALPEDTPKPLATITRLAEVTTLIS
ncbi:MAG: FMN phosphatase YigB, HAD superfamily [Chloroflexi bacterium AL-W]|nr:FMN phosphatase YigB, HAD superfamily [Chloroflexi bacterium AL-N1]NOK66767.1 FMN phosphatase YigB, HAD superfamily [Chloroflexi bacterium AL-N10]NOK74941.1 FMN phosphatase YigB, HAD superfamily [Chloroflexi bacterium AL-N5]NOK81370.1 FMN phosphatase YigB, HAD superfamily [Chloroflexi bacterium AL-W]NOK88839.1 FMN phosphatase YigB, HAD superfamily [Chloroflexi bacterium AL-N15]